MKIASEWLRVGLILMAVLILLWIYVGHFRNKCNRKIEQWSSDENVQINPEDITINFFTYPLQAVVIGVDGNGVRRKYTLQLGSKWRGIFLKNAELIGTDPSI
jgi:hypothetical protein